jgi:hypothetical protein
MQELLRTLNVTSPSVMKYSLCRLGAFPVGELWGWGAIREMWFLGEMSGYARQSKTLLYTTGDSL